MKRFPKWLLMFSFILIIFICFPGIVHAQDGTDPGCDVLDPKCPIDGGLSALLVIGVGYGIKKVRDARQKN